MEKSKPRRCHLPPPMQLSSSRARAGQPCPVGAESEEKSFKSQDFLDGCCSGRMATRTLTKAGSFLFLNMNLHMAVNNLRSFTSSQKARQYKHRKKGTCKLLSNFYIQPKEVMSHPQPQDVTEKKKKSLINLQTHSLQLRSCGYHWGPASILG